MTAGDGNAGRIADRCAAFEDLAHHLGRNLVDRHAENGQRHDRRAAHRIDIRQRIGRGDAAKIARVVHHRHEEVGGSDDAGTASSSQTPASSPVSTPTSNCL